MSTENKPIEFHVLDSEYENHRRCYLRKPVNHTTIHVIEYSAYEQLKVENERLNKLAQGISEREESISAEHKLRIEIESENAVLKSKLEIAKKALNTALNYLHWREDDLIGDDCIGDGKLTAAYKNRVSEIEQALKEINEG